MSKRNRYNNGYIGTDSLYTAGTGIISANKPYLSDVDTVFSIVEDIKWNRPAEWLPMPSLSANDQMFSGLFAVYPGASGNSGASADSNFVAFVLGVCGSNTNYLVDWGDGTAVQQYGSGVTAQYRYNFANIPANTQTPEGFRQVVIKAYPAVAGNTMALIDLQRRYRETGVTFYRSSTPSGVFGVNWLDIKIAGAGVSLCRLAGGGPLSITQNPSVREVRLNSLKQFEWVGESSISNFQYFFAQLPSLIQVVGTEWTSRATTMQEMFTSCPSLLTIPPFDTLNVTSMSSMFNGCISLQTIPPLNTSKVFNMEALFSGCKSLKSIPNMNMSNVTTINRMCSGCVALKTIPPLDLPSCTIASQAFYDASGLVRVPRISLTSRSLTTITQMFSRCYSLQTISVFDLPENPTTGINASNLFTDCNSLESIPESFKTKGIANFSVMFQNCYSLKSVPTIDFSRSSGNASSMFSNCYRLPSVSLTETSKLTDTSNMFTRASSLKTIPPMDLSNVTTAPNMFSRCYSLMSVPSLNLSKCTSMSRMFEDCFSLESVQGITMNTTQSVTANYLFQGCAALKQIPTMNTSRVPDMTSMFSGCTSLISAPLFDLSSCTTVSGMFLSCSGLKTVAGFTGGNNCANIINLFSQCSSLETVPYMALHPIVVFNGAFNGCSSLRSIGGFTASTISDVSTAFSECYNLCVGALYGTNTFVTYTDCNLSPTELNRIFTNLSNTGSGKIISIGGNWGSFTCDRSIATAKGWTVSG